MILLVILLLVFSFLLGYLVAKTQDGLRFADKLVSIEQVNNPSFPTPKTPQEWNDAHAYFKDKYGW